jgi:hypothetical protein
LHAHSTGGGVFGGKHRPQQLGLRQNALRLRDHVRGRVRAALSKTVKMTAGRRLGLLPPRASSAIIIASEGDMLGARRVPLMASVPFMASVLFLVAYFSMAVCIARIMRD